MDDLSQHLARFLRLGVEEISDDLSMADVDTWDSLTHMELVIGLEQAYQVQFTGDDITEMTNVGAIRQALARCLGQG